MATLIVENLVHIHTIESPTLITVSDLEVENLVHIHTIENVSINTSLVVQSSSIAHTISKVLLQPVLVGVCFFKTKFLKPKFEIRSLNSFSLEDNLIELTAVVETEILHVANIEM